MSNPFDEDLKGGGNPFDDPEAAAPLPSTNPFDDDFAPGPADAEAAGAGESTLHMAPADDDDDDDLTVIERPVIPPDEHDWAEMSTNKASAETISNRALFSRAWRRSSEHAVRFGVPLSVFALYPRTLHPVAMVLFTGLVTKQLLGGTVTAWCATRHRLQASRNGLVAEAVGMAATAGMVCVLAAKRSFEDPTSHPFQSLFESLLFSTLLVAHILFAVGDLFGWWGMVRDDDVIPMVYRPLHKRSSARVDATMAVLMPPIVGLVYAGAGPEVGIIVVAAWTGIASVPQYFVQSALYRDARATTIDESAGRLTNPFSALSRHVAVIRETRTTPLMAAQFFLGLSLLSMGHPLLYASLSRDNSAALLGATAGGTALLAATADKLQLAIASRAGHRLTMVATSLLMVGCYAPATIAWAVGGSGDSVFIGFVMAGNIGAVGLQVGLARAAATIAQEDRAPEVAAFQQSLASVASTVLTILAALPYLATHTVMLVLISLGFSALAVVVALLCFPKPNRVPTFARG